MGFAEADFTVLFILLAVILGCLIAMIAVVLLAIVVMTNEKWRSSLKSLLLKSFLWSPATLFALFFVVFLVLLLVL
ncbi:MAG: hypothetical protein FWC49_02590 [Proteobacteria bacterium]|nr:hypothetical protein [Pseudomonadota bacterium]